MSAHSSICKQSTMAIPIVPAISKHFIAQSNPLRSLKDDESVRADLQASAC